MADKLLNLTLSLNAQKAIQEVQKLHKKYEELVQKMKTAEPGTEEFEQLTREITTARTALEGFAATTQDKMAKNLNNGAKQIKGVNVALINTGRIVQDLPYGMLGIANNIDPLVQSFQGLQRETGSAATAMKAMIAGLAGPAGIAIAVSAVTSLIVAFGDDLVRAISDTNEELDEAKRKIDDLEAGLPITEIISQGALTGVDRLNAKIQYAIDKSREFYGVQLDLEQKFEPKGWIERAADGFKSLGDQIGRALRIVSGDVEYFSEQTRAQDKAIFEANNKIEMARLGLEDYSEATLQAAYQTKGYSKEVSEALAQSVRAQGDQARKVAELQTQITNIQRQEAEKRRKLLDDEAKRNAKYNPMAEWLDRPEFQARLDDIVNDSVSAFQDMENHLDFDPYEKQKEFIDDYIEKQLLLREGQEMTYEEMIRLMNRAGIAAEANAEKIVGENDKMAESEEKKKEAQMTSAIESGMAMGEQAKGIQDLGKVSAMAARQQLSAAFSEVVAEAIRSAMKALPYPINLVMAAVAAAAAKALFNSVVPKFAVGGHVSGPGTGTSDSIPALLSNGEFVVNAASAAAAPGLLESINRSPSLASRMSELRDYVGVGSSRHTSAMTTALAASPSQNVVVSQDQRMMKEFGRHLDRQIKKLENLTIRIDAFEVSQAVNDVRDINDRIH